MNKWLGPASEHNHVYIAHMSNIIMLKQQPMNFALYEQQSKVNSKEIIDKKLRDYTVVGSQ